MLSRTPAGEDLVEEVRSFRLDLLRDLTAGRTQADRVCFGELLTRFSRAVTERPGAHCREGAECAGRSPDFGYLTTA